MNKNLIEKINILGPWVHGFFDLGDGIIIKDSDELQRKRLLVVSGYLKDIIRSYYHEEKIPELVVGDIGCNTGYFLFELYKEFKCKKLYGFEPKTSNLKKADFIRDYFEISKEIVVLKKYNLLTPPLKIDKLDLVLCIGVLHHIDDIYAACRNLFSLTNDLVVIECMVLPESLNNEDAEKGLEIKDIIYTDHEFKKSHASFGIMGVKMESQFYDGATAKSGIVTIPTASALCLVLESVGFVDIELEVNDRIFSEKHYNDKGYRQMNTAFITARKSNKNNKSITNSIEETANRIQFKEIDVILPNYIIESLFDFIENNKRVEGASLEIISEFQNSSYISQDNLNLLKDELSEDVLNIVLGFRFQFKTKIKLEYAKFLIKFGKQDDALQILNKLIHTQNLDWRVCYRAYYLIAKIMYEKRIFEDALSNVIKCLTAFEYFFPAIELKLKIIKAM